MEGITVLTVQLMDWCSACPDGSTAVTPEAKLTD